MKSPLLLLAALALILTGCGKPELKIDSSQVEASAGATPVGLLEVHRANSGNAMGVSVGETQAESAFCAATVVGENKIVTSSDCVRSGNDAFDPSKMEFHLNAPGTQKTDAWQVASVHRLKGVAYITLKSAIDEGHAPTKLSLLAHSLPIGDTLKEMPAKIVYLPSPDKEGLAVASLVDTTIQYSAQGMTYQKTYTGNPRGPSQRRAGNTYQNGNYPNGGYQPNGYANNGRYGRPGPNGQYYPNGQPNGVNGNPNFNGGFPNGNPNYQNNSPACTGDCGPGSQTVTETVSTNFSATMNGAGTLGSPVLVNGQVVGVVSNPGSQPGVDNLRWLDARGEQSSFVTQPRPASSLTPAARKNGAAAPSVPAATAAPVSN